MTNGEIVIAPPKDLSIEELELKINQAWTGSQGELIAIFQQNGIDSSNFSDEQIDNLKHNSLSVSAAGGGFDPVTVALLVSLAPLIKAITPLLKPAAESASKVAEKIALDVWEHIKLKLWQDDHVAISEKK